MSSKLSFHPYTGSIGIGSPTAFSPECLLMCLARWSALANAFWHTEHMNRFSPVCVRECTVRLLLSDAA